MAHDRWAEWILSRRFGGDESAAAHMLEGLGKVRDRVLERAEVREGETVLDVGCGDGLIAFGALERVGAGGHVIFSDVSQDLLDVSRELADGDARCEFVLAGAEDLAPIADESVDVVAMRSVIIYVSDKRAAFGEFFRVLRPGGRLPMFEPINRFTYPEPEGRFLGVDVKLEARIERGRIWGSEPPPLDRLLATAPNPNAPTFQDVLAAEFTVDERERFLAYLRPRYEAGEMIGRQAVAYLRARRLTGSGGTAGT